MKSQHSPDESNFQEPKTEEHADDDQPEGDTDFPSEPIMRCFFGGPNEHLGPRRDGVESGDDGADDERSGFSVVRAEVGEPCEDGWSGGENGV